MEKWWESKNTIDISYIDWVGRNNTATLRVGTELYIPASLYKRSLLITGVIPEYNMVEVDRRDCVNVETVVSRLKNGHWFIVPEWS